MTIAPMTAASFPAALEVYCQSWKESHRDICLKSGLWEREMEYTEK